MVVMINKLKEECLQLSKQNKRLEEQVVYYKNRCNFFEISKNYHLYGRAISWIVNRYLMIRR